MHLNLREGIVFKVIKLLYSILKLETTSLRLITPTTLRSSR
jgi:hypothetical protein